VGVARRHGDTRQGDAIAFVDADHSVGAAGDGEAGREVGRGDAERGEVERVLAAPVLASKPMMVLAFKARTKHKGVVVGPAVHHIGAAAILQGIVAAAAVAGVGRRAS
jgi:hypothetical protein